MLFYTKQLTEIGSRKCGEADAAPPRLAPVTYMFLAIIVMGSCFLVSDTSTRVPAAELACLDNDPCLQPD